MRGRWFGTGALRLDEDAAGIFLGTSPTRRQRLVGGRRGGLGLAAATAMSRRRGLSVEEEIGAGWIDPLRDGDFGCQEKLVVAGAAFEALGASARLWLKLELGLRKKLFPLGCPRPFPQRAPKGRNR